jgi:glycosyltransferase involved in cell wall biosynthesis
MMPTSKKIVLHMIPSLGSGGAERMLARIANGDEKFRHIIVIIKKIDSESIFYQINKSTVTIVSLNFEGIKSLIHSINRYLFYLDNYSPNIIQTWMYHSNLFGGIIAYLKGYRNIYWNIRSAEVSLKKMKIRTIFLVLIGSIFSYLVPRKIITCSKRAINVHSMLFYSRKKFFFIPNGIDKSSIVSKKNITNKFPVIGLVARLDPQKNHHNFLDSIRFIDNPVEVVLLGRNVSTIQLSKYNTRNCKITLIDETSEILKYYDKFDFLILPSCYGEAFPNVLIEAMSRGVVCIATDVGDSLSIISSLGYQIQNKLLPKSIAKAINSAVYDFHNDRNLYISKSDGGISRVKTNYLLEEVINKYHSIWQL